MLTRDARGRERFRDGDLPLFPCVLYLFFLLALKSAENSRPWLDSPLSIQKAKAWCKAVSSLHSRIWTRSSHNDLHSPTSVLASLSQSSSTTNWENSGSIHRSLKPLSFWSIVIFINKLANLLGRSASRTSSIFLAFMGQDARFRARGTQILRRLVFSTSLAHMGCRTRQLLGN
ncbi:hypothetical protein EDD85DRAFT_441800 [Armillaria nabsnona]|nr:hypothetical protein EDD85DRAFT_441800 [Armillaria nabsnona]